MTGEQRTRSCPVTPREVALRRERYEVLYRLTAREVMNADLGSMAFIPPHLPMDELLELLLGVDHAWVRLSPGAGRRVVSVVLRQDLLRALEPGHRSYSGLSAVRFRSLAHGSADCACCFHEGRVLHPVRPNAACREVLGLMARKGILYVPVVEGEELVGEIGAADVLRALRRVRAGG